MRLNKLFLLTLLILSSSVNASIISYTFTTLDDPNVSGSRPTGINNIGQIVGVTSDINGNTGAFEYDNGTYKSLPGSSANGINNNGQIVGNTGDGRGYIIDNIGTVSYFNMPSGLNDSNIILHSVATGINDSGKVSGYTPWFGLGEGPARGFVYANGNMDFLSNQGGFYGINNSDKIVGNAGRNGVGAFEYNNGIFQNLPQVSGYENAYVGATGINNNGLVVGYFTKGDGTAHGFIYDGSSYSIIDKPNAAITIITGVNDLGYLVGSFTDNTGAHGFLATLVSPVPEPSEWALMLVGLSAMCWVSRRKQVVGKVSVA